VVEPEYILYKNIKNRREFNKLVDILWAPDYEDRELEAFPTTAVGGFAPWRVYEFLELAKQHPEYHIVSCIEPDLHVNAFVKNALTYYLAEGDSDPCIIHDPYNKLDASFLQALNSGLNKPSA
jgi:hypothetical protein